VIRVAAVASYAQRARIWVMCARVSPPSAHSQS